MRARRATLALARACRRCETERRTSSISKCVHCLWDMAGLDLAALAGFSGMHLFDELRRQMRSGRAPPQSPPQFARWMRAAVDSGELGFSAAADLETVLSMYHAGFVAIFETYRRYDPDGFFAAFAGLGWGDAEAAQLGSALAFAAQHCKCKKGLGGAVSLRLEGNQFGREGQAAIRKAVEAGKIFDGAAF